MVNRRESLLTDNITKISKELYWLYGSPKNIK
jgi:hypothetical protein